MASKLVFIFLFTFTCLIAYSNAARELPTLNQQHSFNIKAMSQQLDESNNSTNGTLANCWNAIAEIKSCGNEITAYFKNGAIDIGVPCCQAINMITQHCWPAMLTALGITPDQCNILVGYCDASVAASPASSPMAEIGELNQTSRTRAATIYNCWNTITNIGSCANEIVDFFVRGTVERISKPCRKEINLLTRQCWPALFAALGITPEECNIILGFCKQSSGSSAPIPSVRYPMPPPKMKKATPPKRLKTNTWGLFD